MTSDRAAVVTAIGMTTPVGLTAAQSCAAVRAGISALTELEYFIVMKDEFPQGPMLGCAVRPVTDGYVGLGRWTRLATAAMTDLVDAAPLSAGDLAAAGLYLALPPLGRRGVDPRIAERLGLRIAQWMDVPGLERRTRVFAEGHAAGALAIQSAVADVTGGAVPLAIVCGVDSLVEPASLRFFLEKKRLKTDDHVDGFVPGEAAACLLIEPKGRAVSRGARPLASVEAASVAVEPVTIWASDPSAATGLSDAARGALEQLADRGQSTRLVVCDLNGETYRAKEFGTAAARVLSAVPNPFAVWHAADCIGDTGAAAFIVSACVGARALLKGYAKSDAVLLLGSSDDGLRGAVSLRRIPAEA
jgi:3-oxoacyl-[acyl-carrier-protein] synthase I